MIDSTNPRVMADNIKKLDAETQGIVKSIATGRTLSTTEFLTGETYNDKPVYSRIFEVNSLPNNSVLNILHNTNLDSVLALYGTATQSSGSGVSLPFASSIQLKYSSTSVIIQTTGDYSGHSGILLFKYTKSAAPSAALSPAPDDSRSLENEDPEIRSEEIEPEVNEEAPEEPVVETKSTTRKKSTSTK